jgi:exodeoxyribonuclease V alpha subunit
LLEASLPDLDLWNGDLGTIERENGVRGFRRGTLFVPEPLLPRHVPGFALTVHKAQGSEFDRVVLVLPDRASAVMSRELLYTGITRARDRVVILGSRTALEAALAAPLVRSSGLRERLAAVSPGAGS